MKRFFSVLILAVGMIPISALAEGSHSFDSSKLKRAVAPTGGTDFASRPFSINDYCQLGRPGSGGGTGAVDDTGGLLEAQIPSSSTGVLGGPPAGAGDVAQGMATYNAKCTGCHGLKPGPAIVGVLSGKPLSAKAAASSMSSVLQSLSAADRKALLAYAKSLN